MTQGPTDDYLIDFPQELYTVHGGGGAQFDQPRRAHPLQLDDGAGLGLRLRRTQPRAEPAQATARARARPHGVRGAPAVGDR